MAISGCTQLTLFIGITGSGSCGSNRTTNWTTVVRFPAMTMSFLFPELTELFVESRVLPCPKCNYSSQISAVDRNAWSHVASAPFVFRYVSWGIISNYIYYYYYYLLQLSFYSVAVVLKLVTNKNKYTSTKQYKNTVNTSTRITKTPTHYKTPTYTHSHITKPTHIHTPVYYKTS